MSKNIIDYLIEQAERFNNQNISFESDILFDINKVTNRFISDVLSRIYVDINTQFKLQSFNTSMSRIFTEYYNKIYYILDNKFRIYYKKSYDNMDILVQIGKEVEGKLTENIKEYRATGNQYSEESINYVRDHAFELIKTSNDEKLNKIKNTVADMMLSGKATKSKIRDIVEKVLDVNRNKAESIAQTELSRIYNYGSLRKLYELSDISGQNVRKYWYGFAYSSNTCPYCLERIGGIYDLDDDSETLPAHVNCRCVWLPILDGWDTAPSKTILMKANMLNTAYSKDMIYSRINNRLGINYAKYMNDQAALDYLSGDRSEKVIDALESARQSAIDNIKSNYNIQPDTSNGKMSKEFNDQMKFWKNYTANAKIVGDIDTINKSVEAIKGVMLLDWSIEQLSKWNTLIQKIKEN